MTWENFRENSQRGSPGPGTSSLLDVTIQMKPRDSGKHLLILKFPRSDYLSTLPTGGCMISSVLPTNPKFILFEKLQSSN